jgi:hypothetical protein
MVKEVCIRCAGILNREQNERYPLDIEDFILILSVIHQEPMCQNRICVPLLTAMEKQNGEDELQ